MKVFQNDLFYCNHLCVSESDEQDVMGFSVSDPNGEDLARYLRFMAFPEEDAGTMRTYIVRDNFSLEMVGYFSLKAGLISINEVHTEDGETFDTIPGVEVANFAVNDLYLKNHPEMKGIGLIIFNDFIIPTIQEASKSVGIKIIYLFAFPYERLIKRYGDYGIAIVPMSMVRMKLMYVIFSSDIFRVLFLLLRENRSFPGQPI